jgi:hypothetical protein
MSDDVPDNLQRRALAGCAVAAVLSAACGPSGAKIEAPQPAQPPARILPESCGGEMPPGTMEAWFTRLDRHLKTSSDPVPLDFYTDDVTLTEGGRTLRFRTRDMGPQARRLPTLEDWREISRRGAAGLHYAGYRGCYSSTGKAWFETNYPDGRFALAGFDHDRAWMPD